MTGHEEADRETAFREFREAFEPLEVSGKLRGVLLQYHPRFKKSAEAKEELAAVRSLLDPLVLLEPGAVPELDERLQRGEQRGGGRDLLLRIPRLDDPRVVLEQHATQLPRGLEWRE